ncbi:AbgT family transporter [Alkalihalobacillus sp. BA299]|uniref:AbgT family transporter n=1 Tax=Alkalihalobacillus sp. BA299 TaxID=2815938 RepID=UPI001ADA94DB|nr:AbgT family transporter [Alkalihalobacillus sp. BA299]
MKNQISKPQAIEPPPSNENKKGLFNQILDKIEVYGNKLPDPLILFVIISAVILVVSFFASLANVSAVNPVTKETISAVNLLSGEGLINFLTSMVTNFSGFPPLGAVLVVLIGVGLGEATGFFSSLMKRTVITAPTKAIIPVVILLAILGNAAADAATVVLPPIAAVVLMSLGFNPLVGLVVAYAATSGAFAANLVIGMADVLAASFTQTGAQIIDPEYVANPAMNYYFIIVSTFLLLIVAIVVTYKITIPRFGTYSGKIEQVEELSSLEKRGLRWAGISTLVLAVPLLFLSVPSDSLLRNSETGSLITNSPFMSALVPLITIFFLVPSLFYGIGAKTVRSGKDVADMLGKSMSTMGPYIVLVFVVAQMLAFFSWSNLGPILAIKGANVLQDVGFTGIPLFIGLIIVIALINLFIGSASAKWAILAPIFVPMFMLLGYDPALTQMLYRIGDSITNPITPLTPYLPLILAYAKAYDPKVGMGTLIAALLPYSIFFGIFWIILIVVWFMLGLPLGPEGPVFLPAISS